MPQVDDQITDERVNLTLLFFTDQAFFVLHYDNEMQINLRKGICFHFDLGVLSDYFTILKSY
jgi:hypothetical protein